MDRLTSLMLRAALIWLLAGFVIGAAMLVDRELPGSWRLWLAPGHGHMLFIGWFLQFAIGVAYWLLPRKRTPERPLGYHEPLALFAAGALNLGLVIRVTGEIAERTGHASDASLALLGAAAILQVGAASIFVAQIWPRVGPRPIRQKSAPARDPHSTHVAEHDASP